jgi:hypothetical protein
VISEGLAARLTSPNPGPAISITALRGARTASRLAQTRPLPKPLLHISGEVFKPAQGSYIDLHVLAMFFHDDRQIEQHLVDRVRTIHIDDSYHTPRAHTFPDVDDHARLLRPKAASASRAQIEKKSFCDMDAEYSMWKSA